MPLISFRTYRRPRFYVVYYRRHVCICRNAPLPLSLPHGLFYTGRVKKWANVVLVVTIGVFSTFLIVQNDRPMVRRWAIWRQLFAFGANA